MEENGSGPQFIVSYEVQQVHSIKFVEYTEEAPVLQGIAEAMTWLSTEVVQWLLPVVSTFQANCLSIKQR